MVVGRVIQRSVQAIVLAESNVKYTLQEYRYFYCGVGKKKLRQNNKKEKTIKYSLEGLKLVKIRDDT